MFVQYRYAFVVTVLVNLVFNRSLYSYAQHMPKRGSVDVFNLLLGLYKLNPLKGSKVYSKFAKNVLAQGEIADALSSNENKNKRSFQELREIENTLHPLIKKQSKHSLEKPKYDIENVDIENFNVDVILRDNLESEFRNDKYGNKNILEEYGIAKSNENLMNDNLPNTKLYPVEQWLLPTSIRHIPILKEKTNLQEYKPVANDNQNRRMPSGFQEATFLSDNVLSADVVVL